MLQKALVSILKTLYVVVSSRIKCEFPAQPSRDGDQRCRIRNRIRIRNWIRIWIRSRIRNNPDPQPWQEHKGKYYC
jgi:hypothetical protein